MTDGPSTRPTGPLLDRITTCPACLETVIDRAWALLTSTTVRDLSEAMGAHFADRHPADLGMFMDAGVSVGLLRPPPSM